MHVRCGANPNLREQQSIGNNGRLADFSPSCQDQGALRADESSGLQRGKKWSLGFSFRKSSLQLVTTILNASSSRLSFLLSLSLPLYR
jgi:hypothetical protein